MFGLLNIFDDPLTEALEPTSMLMGQAQGLYRYVGQQELSLLVAVNFVFTTGKFNGRSLTILGRNAALQPVREMPIIGGIGAFWLARGFVTAKMYFLNFTSGDAIVEYHVVAIHYWAIIMESILFQRVTWCLFISIPNSSTLLDFCYFFWNLFMFCIIECFVLVMEYKH